LRPDWTTWFPGFQVTRDPSGDIVLSGDVVDRAAFYGLITRVRDLGLAVISVERQDRSSSESDERDVDGGYVEG
jgi:hypothetical protein